jgi:hypothetical protein
MSDLDDAVHAVQEKILDIVVPMLDSEDVNDLNVAISAVCGLAAMIACGEGVSRKFFLERLGELYDEFAKKNADAAH